MMYVMHPRPRGPVASTQFHHQIRTQVTLAQGSVTKTQRTSQSSNMSDGINVTNEMGFVLKSRLLTWDLQDTYARKHSQSVLLPAWLCGYLYR